MVRLIVLTKNTRTLEWDHISRCYILIYISIYINIYSSISCSVSRLKHLCKWELITGHNRSLYMGHRMRRGLLPGTQLLFLVLLFRLALSDAQTIQQGIFIDKQFYSIPINKSDNWIFFIWRRQDIDRVHVMIHNTGRSNLNISIQMHTAGSNEHNMYGRLITIKFR